MGIKLSMAMKNKDAKRSRISGQGPRDRALLRRRSGGPEVAALSGLHHNTVNRFYLGLRERMRLACYTRPWRAAI